MGAAGWAAVMDAAEWCTALEAVDGVAWGDMLQGELKTLDLGNKGDAGLAEACATRYLARSASCLISLNMRSTDANTGVWVHARARTHTHAETCCYRQKRPGLQYGTGEVGSIRRSDPGLAEQRHRRRQEASMESGCWITRMSDCKGWGGN